MGDGTLRWKLAEEVDAAGGQLALFPEDDIVDRHVGTGEFRGLEFLHVKAQRVINEVPSSSRVPFRFTINAYRGCSHACVYCFARPTHEYLGLDAGRDFEEKIVVKINAVERVRAEIRSPRWRGDAIAMGTNTDPYQRCEGKYHLTQGIVRALGEEANPFSILTKSTLILRDLELLRWASTRTEVRVNLSIGTLDEAVWKASEPGTPHPRRRVEAVRRLNDAGVSCGVLIAPILPGLSDGEAQLREVIEACVDAGAASITTIPLHLRPGVRSGYLDWLGRHRPDLLADHRVRFRSAYQPKAITDELSATCRRLLGDARAARRASRP